MGTTPIYGFPYPDPSDLVANYPALGQDLAEDVETVISGLGVGLTLLSPTSIANSGGSAAASGGQVTFTGVSSVSLNGVFSATYTAYRIVINVKGSLAASNDILLRVRAAGTDLSGGVYVNSYIYNTQAGGPTRSFATTNTSASLGYTNDYLSVIASDIGSPFATERTTFVGNHMSFGSGGASQSGFLGSIVNNATSYDGFSLTQAGGTITGTVRVYGYENS
jgi:hypothetical protein